MVDYTTEYLINLVKEKETIPDSGAAYSDSVLLNYLDQSLKGFIVPAIESVLEEHFVVTIDTEVPPIPSYPQGSPPTNVPNALTIPSESTGLRLRDLYIVGTDGSFYNLPRLTPSQAASQSFGSPWAPAVNISNSNQFLGGFYLQGNQVQIYPYGLASNKLVRMTYQRAPADLCLTSSAGRVINKVGDVLTLDNIPSGVWTAGITRINVISQFSPNDFVQDSSVPVTVYTSYTPLSNILPANISSNVVTMPTGSAANIQIGDWVCPDGTSVYAQNIPKDLLPALVQKAASMCLHAAGDAEGYKIAQLEYKEMIDAALKLITPRVIGKPIKIIPTNSPFKASRGSNWGRW